LKHSLGVTAMLAWSAAIGFCSSLPPSSTTIFSRPLPTQNVNGEDGATRSNYAVQGVEGSDPQMEDTIYGDSFTLPSNGSNAYVITSLSSYSVASLCVGGNPCTADSQAQPLGDEFENIMLAVREVTSDPTSGALIYGSWDILDEGTPNTSFDSPTSSVVGNSNPNITDTNVQYAGGQNYEQDGSDGSYFPLWQTTFNNLNFTAQAGVQYEFVVWGFGWYNGDTPCTTIDFQCMDPNTGYGYWYSEYSNPFDSGQTEQGATGYYLSFVNFMNPQLCPPDGSAGCSTAASGITFGQDANGNSVALNENVIISGFAVPEPATYALAGLGLVLFACLSRKLRK
jgi:PEP-CTERM motif